MYCYSRFFSKLAQQALSFALVLLIVEETGLAIMSSLLVLTLIVPSTLTGIIAGTAADHLPKRPLIVFGNVTRAGACLLFIVSNHDVGSFYFTAALLAGFGQFAGSAEHAIGPLLVERDELARANAFGQAVGMAAQLLGLGVLAPLSLRLLDSPELLFWVAAALFLLSAVQAVAIGRVRGVDHSEVGGTSGHSWWSAGWRTMRSDPAVMNAAVELTLIGTALIILGGLIPTYISDTLGLPVDVGAIILLPAVVGVAVGLRIAGFLAHRLPHGALSTAGFLTFVSMLALLTFVNEESAFLSGYGLFSWLDRINIGSFDGGGVLAMAIMFPLGFAFAIVNVAGQTVLNHRVPLSLQGRVGATQNGMAALAAAAPTIAAGFLADLAGVTLVMTLVAAGLAVAAIATMRRARSEPAPGHGVVGDAH